MPRRHIGCGGTAPHILNLSTRKKRAINLMFQILNARWKRPHSTERTEDWAGARTGLMSQLIHARGKRPHSTN
jgi:hypothetical protein